MKIFTDKAYREHIEKIKYENDKDKYIQGRLDRLSEDLHNLEFRVQALECKSNYNVPVYETTCEVKR